MDENKLAFSSTRRKCKDVIDDKIKKSKKSDKELKKDKDLGEVLTENFVKKSPGCPCGVAWTNVFRVL
jgi:hypothetical protein